MTKNSFAVELIFKFLWKFFFLFLNLKLQLIPKFEVKEHFPRFPSFRFCPIPKLENSEILESFLLLKFLVVHETQNLKTDWKMTQKKKRLTLWYGLRRKNANFRGFRVFGFALSLKSKIWKPRKVFIYFKFLSFTLH